MATTTTTCLPLFTSTTTNTSLISTPNKFSFTAPRKLYKTCITSTTTTKAKAAASSSSYSITDFDLYDLLGIENTCNQSEIKLAYRMLQKRCHPDIAGPPGHDMAIILNQVYSLLSDPNSRLAYDQEQAKLADVRGYTGKPLYSVWFGSESEERAVFVDEVKCVGCLKCALLAQNSFAIEPAYGRARCVAQWKDPENKIQEAIDACPVDCISVIQRSDLAALEFLMSKQPRGNVRVGAGNTAGARVSNIFVDVKKFQTRVSDVKNKAVEQESELQWRATMSAIQAIMSISNWLNLQSFASETSKSVSLQHTPLLSPKSTKPDLDKLRTAAATMKQARKKPSHVTPLNYLNREEYWSPLKTLPSAAENPNLKPDSNSSLKVNSKPLPTNRRKQRVDKDYNTREKSRVAWAIPFMTSAIAAVRIYSQVREETVSELNEHIGGSWALEFVNSSWLQVTLAGITWYFIGVVMMELVQGFRRK
ncbi:hypothetical protein ACFE04_021186 [Oxalis oulophora]